ncbi:hypothetical protein [Desulfurispira natronophila]|uniref:Cytochrome c domain-containing protein n=1 Tax=Desulfurispira natronophila TaxID=682562 RepID=A0A7W7Y3B4_9BACT|nr:hypothetical protein [Desulfurispira natronophila]MBB5021244.1 hypothetical protein [Desulfurispira natronophila]
MNKVTCIAAITLALLFSTGVLAQQPRISPFQAGQNAWHESETPTGLSCAACHFEGYDIVSRGSFPRENRLVGEHMTLLESIELCMMEHQHIQQPGNEEMYALFQHLSILQENYELNLQLRRGQ